MNMQVILVLMRQHDINQQKEGWRKTARGRVCMA